ncbi:MAG: CD3324 family protein [Lachnospiraceae bacterium]|nr:CD3324 family protein [Lachnospiraceae bacterium]
MGYKSATQILPQDLLQKVQEYVDGEFLYIPRISDNKKDWGAATSTRQELQVRNQYIYEDYLSGESMDYLAEKYFLSLKSIQRIVGQLKKDDKG